MNSGRKRRSASRATLRAAAGIVLTLRMLAWPTRCTQPDVATPDESKPRRGRRLVVVDAANCLYRAFFAIPPLRTKDGTPTNAAYGFVEHADEGAARGAPDHVVVVFDARGGSDGASRPLRRVQGDIATPSPKTCRSQLPLVRELVDAYRIPMLEVPGCEADDVIATLVARGAGRHERLDPVDRQGPDAARLGSRRSCRHHEGTALRPGGGRGALRRAARTRARPARPRRRSLRQHPRREGYRREGRRQADRASSGRSRTCSRTPARSRRHARAAALQEQADAARLSKRLAALQDDVALPLGLDDLARRDPITTACASSSGASSSPACSPNSAMATPNEGAEPAAAASAHGRDRRGARRTPRSPDS